MRWAVGSGNVTRMPKTNSQEELLFGDQEFFEPVNAAGNHAGLFSNVDKHFLNVDKHFFDINNKTSNVE